MMEVVQAYQSVLLWGFAFVFTHFAMARPPLRDVLVSRIGEKPYLGLYSLISLVLISVFVRAYNAAPLMDLGWMNQVVIHWLVVIVMPIIFILFAAAILNKNPGLAGMVVDKPIEVRGILRVTRHPMLWSFVLFSLLHILASGDAASLILFSFIGFLSGYGTITLDRKKARLVGKHWEEFARQTSNIPFAAIIGGRQQLVLSEIGWPAVILGIILTIIIYMVHILVPMGTILVNPLM